MEMLPGDYIAGFVDGEGCFALKFIRSVRHDRKNKPVYFYWDVEFIIALRIDDKEILEKIRTSLECGRISLSKSGEARFYVNAINDLKDKLVPFFEKYSLRAKKQKDFLLWKEALMILYKNQQINILRRKQQKGFLKINMNETDRRRLREIHEEMKPIKSKRKADWKWLNAESKS